MPAELACIEERCRARFPITEILYNCPRCGGLLDAVYGMTCVASQAVRLGATLVACVSTGNTSASMAAYASAAGLRPVVFIPHGNISFGKLAQALEYGARTIQVEANFDQILALVRQLAD